MLYYCKRPSLSATWEAQRGSPCAARQIQVKSPLLQMKMTNNLCTQRRWDSEGGCQGSENETATPLQPLDRMKKERETGVAGCLREGGSSTWGQNGRHKPPSSSSQRQGDTGATVPIEVFVSQALSCFSSANRGYNEGGMLPSPHAKGCQYWTYHTLNGRISLPMKIKSMTCFPWLSSLWSGWQL